MIVYGKLLLTAFFWGGTFIAGRAIAGHVGPFSAAFLRFAIASVFLGLSVWRFDGGLPHLNRRQWLPMILLGLTGVFSYNVFFFKGLHLIEAGRAAVIIATNPVMIALFAALVFKEHLTRLKLFGTLLSIAGAMTVITRGEVDVIVHGGLGKGELYIFGCVFSWVTFSLVGKWAMARTSPLAAIFYASVIGAAALFVPAVLEGLFVEVARYRMADWGSLFYLGFFGTVLGFVWYYQGIRTIGPSRASLFINFVPISAVLLAFLILHEPLTPSLLIGTALVCTGMYLNHHPAGQGKSK